MRLAGRNALRLRPAPAASNWIAPDPPGLANQF